MYKPRNTAITTSRARVNKPPAKSSSKREFEAQDPSIFAGPAGWLTLHSAATTYEPTPSRREGFKALVKGFETNFPCENCRRNFSKHLKELPLEKYLGNRDELFLWTYLMHDKVNQLKKVKSPPLQRVKKYYFESLGVDCSNCE